VSLPLIQPDFMVGVTGTNGKTSVTQWIAQALDRLGRPCAIVGTLGHGFSGDLLPGPNTTPGAHVLADILPAFVQQGAAACAMEVSSIGLHQNRVAHVRFDVAVLTNLTRDHLEYHPSMQAYAAEKRKLFFRPEITAAVLNLDDPFGLELAAALAGRTPTIGYTLDETPALAGRTDRLLCATGIEESTQGISFMLDGLRCAAPLVGRFNAANLLAVIGALLVGGHRLEDIARVLPDLRPPAGRMESLGGEGAPLVIVDYAHTPDALEKVLTTVRGTVRARGGRLICVFGCGGDRDPGKRPLMGAVAERLADQVVLTSDNPRSEDPQSIIAAIVSGMRKSPRIEADRGRAIETTLAQADESDVIVLAGKGHEPYQEIAGVRLPFSDAEHVKSTLAGRLKKEGTC